jgi:hypothetical protein
MTWARILSEQAIVFPIENDLNVGGTSYAAIKLVAPTAATASRDFVFMDGGTNDGAAYNWDLTKIPTVLADATQGRDSILALGKIPLIAPVTPRTAGANANTKAWISSFNSALLGLGDSYASVMAGGSPSRTRAIILDISSLVDGNGDAVPGAIGSDGLHWDWLTGFTLGGQIWNIGQKFGVSTTNRARPAGTSLTALGSMAGIAGSKANGSGFTASGDVATGWRINRGAATSTMTAVCSKDPVRGQRIQIATSSLGNATEIVSFNIAADITTGFAAGDRVLIQGRYWLDAVTNLQTIQPSIKEVGPASPQNVADMGGNAATPMTIPNAGVFRSPVMTLQSGVTAINTAFAINLATSVSPVNVDLYIGDVDIINLDRT